MYWNKICEFIIDLFVLWVGLDQSSWSSCVSLRFPLAAVVRLIFEEGEERRRNVSKSNSAPLPSYYFTLCRGELAERLKRLANLLVTCPRETTIWPKKWNRVGAAVGFYLIILMIGSHEKKKRKKGDAAAALLPSRARSADVLSWISHTRVSSWVSDWLVF